MKTWLIGLGAAAAIGVGAYVALFQGDGPERPVDPGFDVRILTWRCGHANAVTADQTHTAEGEFCYVAVDLANTGDSPLLLDPGCQFLIDREAARYTPDPDVMSLDSLAGAGFGETIQPGGLVENSALYYDVPKGTDPAHLELHGDCQGPGTVLALTQATKASG